MRLFQDTQYFCYNKIVEMKGKFLKWPFIVFSCMQPLSLTSPCLISPRLSNIAAITHVEYSPNTFDFTANILRVLVCIVNMVVINHDVLVAKPLLCHTVSFMEISKSLDLVFELFWCQTLPASDQQWCKVQCCKGTTHTGAAVLPWPLLKGCGWWPAICSKSSDQKFC